MREKTIIIELDQTGESENDALDKSETSEKDDSFEKRPAKRKLPRPNDSVVEVIDLSDSSDCIFLGEDDEHNSGSPSTVMNDLLFTIDRTPTLTPDFIPVPKVYPTNNRFTKCKRRNCLKSRLQPPEKKLKITRSTDIADNTEKVKNRNTKYISCRQNGRRKKKCNETEELSNMNTINKNREKIPQISLEFSNIINNNPQCVPKKGLRPVVIDGANVGRRHAFSSGKFVMEPVLQIIDYFKKRGHREIICFLPHTLQFAVESQQEREVVEALVQEGIMSFTPRRQTADGKKIAPYDDRIIVQYASEKQGVIISNDLYRDLINEEPAWRETIENRLINFTIAGGLIMLPKDPLGPEGPTLDEILKFPEQKIP